MVRILTLTSRETRKVVDKQPVRDGITKSLDKVTNDLGSDLGPKNTARD